MEVCCNAHDVCYDTCNSDKELCDLDFKRCLYKYCDEYEKNVVGELVVKGKKRFEGRTFSNIYNIDFFQVAKRPQRCSSPVR